MNTLMSWMVFLFTESRRWNWVLFSFSHKTKFLNPESIGPGTRRSCRYTIFPINCSLLTVYVYSLVLTLSWTAEGFLERVSCEKYCNQYPKRSLCPEKKGQNVRNFCKPPFVNGTLPSPMRLVFLFILWKTTLLSFMTPLLVASNPTAPTT